MYGITTIGNQNLSDYNSRTVIIDVITGGSHKKVRNSHSTLKVPYSSLSQTIGRITSRGGKILSISIPSFSPTDTTVSIVSTAKENELVITEEAAVPEKIVKQDTVKSATAQKENLVVEEKSVESKDEVKPDELTVASKSKSKSKNIAIPFKDLIPKKEKKSKPRRKNS